MKEVLLVKHAVGGRTFIHTGQQPMGYSVFPWEDGWKISIQLPHDFNVQEILKWKHELNVFVFQEFDDRPVKKIWFYVKEGPVNYDDQLKRLTIVAQSRIEYVPSDYGI